MKDMPDGSNELTSVQIALVKAMCETPLSPSFERHYTFRDSSQLSPISFVQRLTRATMAATSQVLGTYELLERILTAPPFARSTTSTAYLRHLP